MTLRLFTFGAFLALNLVAVSPATAQLDSLQDPLPRTLGEAQDRRLDRAEQTLREMRAILLQGRETGRPVVVQPAETQGQLEIVTRRVNDLQETLTRLNGQIDQLAADIAAIRRQAAADANASRAQSQALAQVSSRVDAMDRQIQALVEAERIRNEDPAIAYGRAVQLFMDGRMAPAAEALEKFISSHPDDERVAEARYYLGEALFRQASYTDAARSYLAAVRGYPATAWAPDAMVKLALSLIESGRPSDACGVLTEFNTRYVEATLQVRQQAASAKSRARCP